MLSGATRLFMRRKARCLSTVPRSWCRTFSFLADMVSRVRTSSSRLKSSWISNLTVFSRAITRVGMRRTAARSWSRTAIRSLYLRCISWWQCAQKNGTSITSSDDVAQGPSLQSTRQPSGSHTVSHSKMIFRAMHILPCFCCLVLGVCYLCCVDVLTCCC